jgi:hypothetical protein
MPSLQAPEQSALQVWIHHVHEPSVRVVGGVSAHVPEPPEQPAWPAVYHLVILVPGAVINLSLF